ncbi:RNA polymerase sigma factor [Brevundimonas aurifodinae]|uniref:Sigma-70 family RNA polymerase sigma factor n=1 Tax=Brevundimonas aurifodinae TaxID=1508312 RepID=A0ABV1NK54_9CAUL
MTLPRYREPNVSTSATPRIKLVPPLTRPAEVLRLVNLRLRDGRAGHLRFLRQRLRSKEDAEDVLQEFALKATQGARYLANPGKIDAWLGVALRNALFDRYRRNASRARLNESIRSQRPFSADNNAGDGLDPALSCLFRALGDLKPEAALLLRRAELQDTPLKVIGEEMHLTANNVGVRVHRARAALRHQMQAQCTVCPNPCALGGRLQLADDIT